MENGAILPLFCYMKIKPREYQVMAVDAVIDYFKEHKGEYGKNPLVVLPTGTGKSIIAAELCRFFMQFDDTNILLLTHSSELVKQDAEKITAACQGASIGIFSAQLGRKNRKERIICGTVQSVYRRLERTPNWFGPRRLLIIDEAHRLSSKDSSMYQKAIKALRETDPKMRVVGLTATPYRQDCGMLTNQDNAIFTDVCIDLNESIPQFIDQGYLSNLVTLPCTDKSTFDFSKVRITNGDYNSKDAEAVLSDLERLKAACNLMIEHGQDRRAWLVFVSGIFVAETVAEMLRGLDIDAATVNSKRTKEENDTAIAAFRAGKLKCLVSADQLTTGFDVPQIDLIGMLRPTVSTVLHVQMMGRGMRPCEGKTDCLVLDFVRNFDRLGPVNRVVIPEKKDDEEEAKEVEEKEVKNRLCEKCGRPYKASLPLCPHCGFPNADRPVKELVGDIDLTDLSSEAIDFSNFNANKVQLPKPIDPNMWSVLNMVTQKHQSKSGHDCVKFTFVCSKPASKSVRYAYYYMNFDSGKISAKEAGRKWHQLGGTLPPPIDTAEALGRLSELKKPNLIEVIRRTKDNPFDKIKRIVL